MPGSWCFQLVLVAGLIGILGNISLIIQQTNVGTFTWWSWVPKSSNNGSLNASASQVSACIIFSTILWPKSGIRPVQSQYRSLLPKNMEIGKGITCGHLSNSAILEDKNRIVCQKSRQV